MREATRARAVLAVLLLASLTLVLLDVRGSAAVDGMRSLVSAIVGPVEKAAGAAAAPFVSVGRSITSFGDASDRNGIAADELAMLTKGDVANAEVARQAGELEKMLGLAGAAGYTVIPARVVAYGSAQTYSGTVTIDAGSADGISADMSVITGAGLVGKVISVSGSTATIQLITDESSVVASRVERTGEVGALAGDGSPDAVTLRMLDPTSPLAVDDKIITFGSPEGRPYAPGLPLGTVAELRGEPGQADRAAVIRPAVDLTALDIVGIVIVQNRAAARAPVTPTAPAAPAAGAQPSPPAATP